MQRATKQLQRCVGVQSCDTLPELTCVPIHLIVLCLSDPRCQFLELYPTFHVCCDTHLWWQGDCSAFDENGQGGTPKHSNQYFADFDSGSCLRDCEPGPFGCASVPPPIEVYETIEACCSIAQTWVDIDFCMSRSNGTYSDGWVVNFEDETCGKSEKGNFSFFEAVHSASHHIPFTAQDCDPSNATCFYPKHDDASATIYSSVEECCGRLNWIELDFCVATSTSSARFGKHSNMYFADFGSGSCFRDCEGGPGCASLPPPIKVYETIEVCCSSSLNWVDTEFCLSRSNGTQSNGWFIADWMDEKCGESAIMDNCTVRGHRFYSRTSFRLSIEQFKTVTLQKGCLAPITMTQQLPFTPVLKSAVEGSTGLI